jgi:hypothetical protein
MPPKDNTPESINSVSNKFTALRRHRKRGESLATKGLAATHLPPLEAKKAMSITDDQLRRASQLNSLPVAQAAATGDKAVPFLKHRSSKDSKGSIADLVQGHTIFQQLQLIHLASRLRTVGVHVDDDDIDDHDDVASRTQSDMDEPEDDGDSTRHGFVTNIRRRDVHAHDQVAPVSAITPHSVGGLDDMKVFSGTVDKMTSKRSGGPPQHNPLSLGESSK